MPYLNSTVIVFGEKEEHRTDLKCFYVEGLQIAGIQSREAGTGFWDQTC